MEKYYEILGVPEHATLAEIKQRYRFLCQAYHPDKFSSASHKAEAEAEFKRMGAAYAVLSDPVDRARYDRNRVAEATRASGQARTKPPPQATPKPAPEKSQSTEPERPTSQSAPDRRRTSNSRLIRVIAGVTLLVAALFVGGLKWRQSETLKWRQSEIAQLVREGDQWMQSGERSRAVRAYKEATILGCNSPDVWNKLADACFRVSDAVEGINALKQAAKLCPNKPLYWHELAEAYHDAKMDGS